MKLALFSLEIYKLTACKFFDFVELKNITLEKVYCESKKDVKLTPIPLNQKRLPQLKCNMQL